MERNKNNVLHFMALIERGVPGAEGNACSRAVKVGTFQKVGLVMIDHKYGHGA